MKDQIAMEFVRKADQLLASRRCEAAEQLVLQGPSCTVGDNRAALLNKSLFDGRSRLFVVITHYHHPITQVLKGCRAGIRTVRVPTTAINQGHAQCRQRHISLVEPVQIQAAQ